VCAEEVDTVRKQLAEVAAGRRFLLQGGDCAERFADCSASIIENKLRIILQVSSAHAKKHVSLKQVVQMSLILTWGARMPTLRIGRIAGQYSKPRSADYEEVEGSE
jgi:3-deoxy-7-phosphoheptulonate synthase